MFLHPTVRWTKKGDGILFLVLEVKIRDNRDRSTQSRLRTSAAIYNVPPSKPHLFLTSLVPSLECSMSSSDIGRSIRSSP